MSEERSSNAFAHPPSTLRIGDVDVYRLGYGAMRLPGPEVWGEPTHPERARAVLRRTAELGINFIDTSWYYGPHVSNRLIAEILHPYPADLVIACKLGAKRLSDKSWAPYLRPEELRQGCEEDLRSLKRETLDVVHLRTMPGVDVPFLESLDAMIGLQREGKIKHIGLSNVTVAQLEQALARTPIVTVQNMFNITGSGGNLAKYAGVVSEAPDVMIEACEARGIAFLPFFPLAVGNVGKAKPALAEAAKKHGATEAQVAIAWLLARSKVILPIPGTGSVEHLDENWGARKIALTKEEVTALAEA